MKSLVRDYGAKWIFFTDDTFFVDKQHTEALCRLIIDSHLHEKVKWDAQIRSSLIREKDLDLLKLMRKANCRQIDIGFETFNQRMLTYIKGAGIRTEDHHRAIDVINRAGLHVYGTFIFGTPTETQEEMMETVRNIEKYKP